MITRRRVLLVVLVLFLVGVGIIAWTLAGLPPIKYYVRYGLDPYCGPTGERVTYEGVEFIEIGPGIFRMGSTYLAEGGDWLWKICAPLGLPWGKRPRPSSEMPVHWVEFRRGFWIATMEITNAQYERFRPENDRNPRSTGNAKPVVDVSWEEAKGYCAWLAGKSRRPIRLPTEAEWECGCRAGSDGEFAFGDDEGKPTEFMWYDENSRGRAHAVGTRRPNRWGLFDLHGNVCEWCEDAWHDSHDEAPADGMPRVDRSTPDRVRRGGCWIYEAEWCRSAYRVRFHAAERNGNLGFRPAFSNQEPK